MRNKTNRIQRRKDERERERKMCGTPRDWAGLNEFTLWLDCECARKPKHTHTHIWRARREKYIKIRIGTNTHSQELCAAYRNQQHRTVDIQMTIKFNVDKFIEPETSFHSQKFKLANSIERPSLSLNDELYKWKNIYIFKKKQVANWNTFQCVDYTYAFFPCLYNAEIYLSPYDLRCVIPFNLFHRPFKHQVYNLS